MDSLLGKKEPEVKVPGALPPVHHGVVHTRKPAIFHTITTSSTSLMTEDFTGTVLQYGGYLKEQHNSEET
jgi:hypothetical protein